MTFSEYHCLLPIWFDLYSQFQLETFFFNSLQQQQNQKHISMADMKLKPRHKPSKPPVLAA